MHIKCTHVHPQMTYFHTETYLFAQNCSIGSKHITIVEKQNIDNQRLPLTATGLAKDEKCISNLST